MIAYAEATSCPQGRPLTFRLDGDSGVHVHDATTGAHVLTTRATGPRWRLTIPGHWPSSLYRAHFTDAPSSEVPRATGELPGVGVSGDDEVYFVVTPSGPKKDILVSIPFGTWQAYNRAGVPGEGLYWTEDPHRAAEVTFDRPGGGPSPERWEDGFLRWLRPAGFDADFCDGLDLSPELLDGYRLLVVNGHDEYWTREMRDACEEFVRRGGNMAIFAGNTAWWQARLEGRTLVCHRDPFTDPVEDPSLVTAEWSAVGRPENTLTGVSFRAGAGTWGPSMPLMNEESYVTRFAGHWVFEGTGLTEGDKFAQGALGYETDAAEFTEVGGVPRVTSRDGTPSSFTILATADLRHWRSGGQGGWATMGVFTSGRGTVFNAATVNWGNTLHDPVVDRITRNVMTRLSSGYDGWDVIGEPSDVRALAADARVLYGVTSDGALMSRELCAQNVPWRPIGWAGDVTCLDTPREAAGTRGVLLYGVTADGVLRSRAAVEVPAPWTDEARCPEGTLALAVADCTFWAATASGRLWALPFTGEQWLDRGPCDAVAMSGMNGRLYALTSTGELVTRRPDATDDWHPAGDLPEGTTTFTAHAGRLAATAPGEPLRWRAAPRAGDQSSTGP
ncbi:N,N-dimethylformamidase beta subunit family domain-containing protein [Herbidospora cretacea]|uniref:N,N-dimethylformamidase beta subunit family domain-containing protein n=1 Tax=Herbidospora cretacea TaxID=28444 RepID=UPI00069249A3|nr:N,N-dimethylformamidase beta subunit family domain-containing protein [Herbidospora cretacea]